MRLLLLAAACRRNVPLPPLEPLPPSGPAEAAAGVIAGGTFEDATWPLKVPIPEGWTARPGQADSPLRLSAEHALTRARVEVFALPAGSVEPPPRAGCAWDFVDTGRYRGLSVTDEVTVATCTPDEPSAPHVFAVLLLRPELTWSLTVSAWPEQMVAGKEAGEALLRGVRFEP